ncbi:E3 ubiquitin- ligase TRIM39-like isoform X1 [Labeo rohita]|uniref:E3 ubiquitin-ligase TRIM39-like isoform X1 n=1 Tax=Labeo rohita TaxID=84645 RepID=A0A498LNW5_LABRO|nr:E3 ubiquitin- ligase TRIM39-like isoform X1 [Labeo rohita]
MSLRVKPQRVGVVVDYEEGLVSFYDVESSSHIYSYTAPWFTSDLRKMKASGRALERRYNASGLTVHKLAYRDHQKAYLKSIKEARSQYNSNIRLIKTQKDVQQMIQDRIKKIQDIKHSAEVRKIYLSMCSPINTRNWPEISVKTHESLKALRRVVTQLQDTLNRKLSHPAIGLKWMQHYADSSAAKHFRMHRTKCTEMINGVLAPYFLKRLVSDIGDSKYSLLLDESTDTQLMKTQKDVQQMIQDRVKKIEDIKHSAEVRKIYSSLCSPTNTRNWPEISIETHKSMATLRRALTQLQDTLNKKLSHSVTELKWMQQYAVDVTLDPDTANSYLILTDNGKQVRCGDIKQKLPDNPKRFGRYVNVLGKEGFSSGRFYFEVQVKKKTGWDLGVARESIDRKGKNSLCPNNGYWTVVLRNGNEYSGYNNPNVSLSLRVKPQRVGVFVDYEKGLVSFYDVESSSHIYSFTDLKWKQQYAVKPQQVSVFVDYEEGLVSFYDVESSSLIHSYTGQSFSGKLYPYFSPGSNNGDLKWERTMAESSSTPTKARKTRRQKGAESPYSTSFIRFNELYKTQLMKTQKDVQQMIQDRIKKIEDIKHSAEVRKIYPSLCSPTNTRNWPEISVKTDDKSLETLRRALTDLQETLDEKLTQTAPQFLAGNFHVAYNFINPSNGYWTVVLRKENEYKALSDPPVSLSLKVKLQRVGVFVDYEEGLVSFYDVESSSHIYSYTERHTADDPGQNEEDSRYQTLSRSQKMRNL